MAWSVIVGIWEITSDLITLTKADRRNRETILKRYGIQWHNSEFGGLNKLFSWLWMVCSKPAIKYTNFTIIFFTFKEIKRSFCHVNQVFGENSRSSKPSRNFFMNCPLPLRSCLYTRLLQFLRATKLSYKNKNNLYL